MTTTDVLALIGAVTGIVGAIGTAVTLADLAYKYGSALLKKSSGTTTSGFITF